MAAAVDYFNVLFTFVWN